MKDSAAAAADLPWNKEAVVSSSTSKSSSLATLRTTSTKKNQTSDDSLDDIQLLEAWVAHDYSTTTKDMKKDHKAEPSSFHDFSPSEARAIRTKLLSWYDANRRKLPWRGDPPPWDGSTALAATSNRKKKKEPSSKGVNAKGNYNRQQPNMTAFFGPKKETRATTSKRRRAANDADDDADNRKKSQTQKVASSNSATTTLADASMAPAPPAASITAFPVTAYGVWVSEIMLQQTRVEAVIPYWVRWMQDFPTVRHLAAATPDQVNAHWAGLGFYRRARLLHQAAQELVAKADAAVPDADTDDTNTEILLPDTVDGLLNLSGVGRYTASAMASIAYNVSVPVVDGNVCRVLSRLRGIAQTIKAAEFKDQRAWQLAHVLVVGRPAPLPQQTGRKKMTEVPATATSNNNINIHNNVMENGYDEYDDDDPSLQRPGDLNQALMELGATHCAPSGTGVDEGDPLREHYYSTRLGRAAVALEKKQPGRLNVLLQISTAAAAAAAAGNKDLTPKGQKRQRPTTTNTIPTNRCRFCAADGVVEALTRLSSLSSEIVGKSNGDITNTTDNDEYAAASKCGHATFPLTPVKNAKREEVIAVAVLSRTSLDDYGGGGKSNQDGNEYFLLVRRPPTGLLAGQWEFPSVCVWSSDDGPGEQGTSDGNTKAKKRKDMSNQIPTVPKTQRRKALDAMLEMVDKSSPGTSMSGMVQTKRSHLGTLPITHVFSHVRHTMWVEWARVVINKNPSSNSRSSSRDKREKIHMDNGDTKSWKCEDGREVRWMRHDEMKKVGVTSGVQKILSAVQKEQPTNSSGRAGDIGTPRRKKKK